MTYLLLAFPLRKAPFSYPCPLSVPTDNLVKVQMANSTT